MSWPARPRTTRRRDRLRAVPGTAERKRMRRVRLGLEKPELPVCNLGLLRKTKPEGKPRKVNQTGCSWRSEWAEFGAGDRIRTGDIDLGKVALYQLSYSRSA